MLSASLLEQLQLYLTSFQTELPLQEKSVSKPSFSFHKNTRKQNDICLEIEEAILAEEPATEIAFVTQPLSTDASSLDDYIRQHQTSDTFHSFLFRLIDASGLSDADVYKRADIDRRHFSKICSNPLYHPKKQTVLALCFALHLNEPDAMYLLTLAGYSLSTSDISDLIILFFLEKGIYNLAEINEALDYFGQPLLTSI